ncbi:MAG: DUF418 domain-containing protein [Candidatus Eisenbacteria bacterium]
MEHQTATVGPVTESERIVSLDALRGFAILGILVMNIQSFSMISAAYLNPTAYGNFEGLNRLVWTLSHVFADQKFLSIFSMLFGAGIILMFERCAAAGRSMGSLHYRRSFWLLVFGLAHGALLWYGDILATYAVCAMVVFLFRRVRPVPLTIVGVLAFLVPAALWNFFGWSMRFWPPEAIEQTMLAWAPPAEVVAEEIAAYTGGWLAQMPHRLMSLLFHDTFLLVFYMGFRASGLMLVGMALYKWGVIVGRRSRTFYATFAVGCLAAGLALILFGLSRNMWVEWMFEYSMFQGSVYNYVGSAFVALAYISIVMLATRGGGWLARLLAPVGRMAFTNYLMQTVICTFIFYGHGLGLFGRVERTGQILIVFAVWIFQLWFSRFWLARFRLGPAEWLWRSLSYGRRQPMRRVA